MESEFLELLGVKLPPRATSPEADADAALLSEAERILRGTHARIGIFLLELDRYRARAANKRNE